MAAYKPNINSKWPVVDPGDFRQLITLLTPVVSSDVSGTVMMFAATSTTAWAKVEYIRGSELIKAGQDVTQQFLKVTSWWNPSFNATSRIQMPSGAQYIIQAVENVQELSIYMVLTALGIGGNN